MQVHARPPAARERSSSSNESGAPRRSQQERCEACGKSGVKIAAKVAGGAPEQDPAVSTQDRVKTATALVPRMIV
eukprot:2799325-Pleurochrysis_carterae.AAC.2